MRRTDVACASQMGATPPANLRVLRVFALVLILMVGCVRPSPCPHADGALVAVGSAGADDDADGIDDNLEDALARAYLPFLAGHPRDACPLGGLVFRVRPHPDDHALVLITYSHVYEVDCGLNGHVGDNEAFGVAIDPRIPPPAGILSVVAVSHQGTACERTTVCGRGPDLTPCDERDGRPILYSSRDKHAGSVSLAWGCGVGSCLDECAAPLLSDELPRANAGEPDHPLTHDLTRDGFITRENGWRAPDTLHTDPWSDRDFGGAGNIQGDLLDDAFVAPPSSCR